MAIWARDLIQGWVTAYEIPVLVVNLELPFFNESPANHNAPPGAPAGRPRSIKTFMIQMRQVAAYEDMLFDLRNVEVWLGIVHNTTAKSVFTGDAAASKAIMVARSVWAKRPDIGDDVREHLADAQGIGTVYPDLCIMSDEALKITIPKYTDHDIGRGPLWQPKRGKQTNT